MAVDISIILINWRMCRDLSGCLASIEQHKHACAIEVLLVNKPSGDGTEELIREKHPWVKLIEHPKFGFATMRNVGLEHAKGRYCLVLDTDIEVLPGCFDGLMKYMDERPDFGGCGGHTTRLNGDVEFNVKRFYTLATIIARRSWMDRYWPMNPWNRYHLMMDKDHEQPFEGDWMAGACFCMRREVVRDVGYFDETMHYFEDVDWCWRAKAAGWKIGFSPKGRIIHKVRQLSKKGFTKATWIHLKSGLRFWLKIRQQGMNWAWPTRPYSIGRRSTATLASSESRPDISLIIVNHDAKGPLLDALHSLPEATRGIEAETILVDNASTDGYLPAAREAAPTMQVIENAENLGFTKANNQGIVIAKGRYLCLLNNDTISKPEAFTKAVEFLDDNPDVGVLGLKLLNPDGSLQLSCRRFPSFSQALFNRDSLLTKLFPKNRFSARYLMTDMSHNRVDDVDWVSGACLIIRRETLTRVGNLDERFFMYSEDVDYCYRVWQAGYRVAYLPTAEVTHLIGQSSRKRRYLTTFERHRSMYKFYKKHYSRNLMFVDALTGITILLRCGLKLIETAAWNALRARPVANRT